MEKLNEKPEEITIALLEVVIMPNGEIISYGKSIGYYESYKNYLYKKDNK